MTSNEIETIKILTKIIEHGHCESDRYCMLYNCPIKSSFHDGRTACVKTSKENAEKYLLRYSDADIFEAFL